MKKIPTFDHVSRVQAGHPSLQNALARMEQDDGTALTVVPPSGGGASPSPHMVKGLAETIASSRVKIAHLHALDQAAVAEIEAKVAAIRTIQAQRYAIWANLRHAAAQIEAGANAPVPGGADPTLWLPNEVLLIVLRHVEWPGFCFSVCRRWRALCAGDPAIQRATWTHRWQAYSMGWRYPRHLTDSVDSVFALAAATEPHSGETVLFSGSKDAPVRQWCAATGANIRTMEGHSERVFAVAVCTATGRAFSASADGTVRVWWIDTGAPVATLVGHDDAVIALAIGTGGRLFSGSKDGTIRMWAVGTTAGAALRVITTHAGTVYALAATPGGSIYSGSADSTIQKFSPTGDHLQTLVGHSDGVYAVAVGDDGTVYSGSGDRRVCAWCGASGRLLHVMLGHTDAVFTVLVGAENLVFTGSSDRTIRLWDGATGAAVYTLHGHTGYVEALALGSDGRLYSGARDETAIRVW